jgi:hypothetical protein
LGYALAVQSVSPGWTVSILKEGHWPFSPTHADSVSGVLGSNTLNFLKTTPTSWSQKKAVPVWSARRFT